MNEYLSDKDCYIVRILTRRSNFENSQQFFSTNAFFGAETLLKNISNLWGCYNQSTQFFECIICKLYLPNYATDSIRKRTVNLWTQHNKKRDIEEEIKINDLTVNSLVWVTEYYRRKVSTY